MSVDIICSFILFLCNLSILDTNMYHFFAIDEWWLTYGCSAPNLQKLAIHVLSQTCSASGCERNWSLFEHIHSKKRNRLEHQRMNDMAYVQCNSRLEQKYFLLFIS